MVTLLMPPRRAPSPSAVHIGGRLRALRERVGKTQKDVAEALAIDARTVGAYENGRATVRSIHFEKWAVALGVSLPEFTASIGMGMPPDVSGLRREAAALLGPDDGELLEEAVSVLADWDDEAERRRALEITHSLIMNWPGAKGRQSKEP